MRRLRPRVSSPQPGTSHVPPCVEILALLVRKGTNWRGGGAGTGEGAWKAEVSAVGFRSTLLLSTFHSTPLNIHTTLSRTPLSIPSPPQRRQVDISAGENLSRPPTPSVWSPTRDKSGKEGQASWVWEALSFPAASEPASQAQLLLVSFSANWDSSLLTLKLHPTFRLALPCLGCICL